MKYLEDLLDMITTSDNDLNEKNIDLLTEEIHQKLKHPKNSTSPVP